MSTPFYQLAAEAPNGTKVSMSDFEGKVVLIVNTATKCGLAPQFKGLEDLHQKHKDQGLVILGFPCNQFLNQEPETDETMAQSCEINFGVTFPLLAKCDVNGPNTHPVFKFLKSKLGGFLGSKIKWNFTKFLVDANGKPFKRYSPTTKPEKMEAEIIQLLKQVK